MITLPRSLLRRLRLAFGRGLGVNAKATGPSITVEANHEGVSIQAGNADFSIRYLHAGEQGRVTFTAPFELLRRCEGTRKHEDAELSCDGRAIFAQWFEKSLPKNVEFDAVEPSKLPVPPSNFVTNPPELLDALREAATTADAESTRYALTHMRLRGDGQIAATDGRQLLIQSGFEFPWDNERLVPANRLLERGDLSVGEPVDVGHTDEYMVFRTGPWTVWLKTLKEGQFPKIDELITNANLSKTTLHVTNADAKFVAETVASLPGKNDFNSPTTVDLNGSVALRAKASTEPALVELVLTNSHREGAAIRFSTDRKYFARAMKLGFRTFEVASDVSPVCCRDGNRTYLWALLNKEGIISSAADAIRIESQSQSSAAHSNLTLSQRMSMSRTSEPTATDRCSAAASDAANDSDNISVAELIASAEKTRTTLRTSMSAVTTLVSQLKQHHKRTKSLRKVLSSIRDLQPTIS